MRPGIKLRTDYDAARLRALAKATRNAGQSRRLLALAEIYDGGSRNKAARVGGVGLQTVRDWVVRFNARGPEALSSDALVGRRMAISFAIEHHDCLVDGIIEVVWTVESLVSKMMLLQIAPELFDVVERRRVFRQPFDREPGRPLGECGARRLAGVDRAIVEDEHDRLLRTSGRQAILRVDLFQKRDEIGTALAPAGAHNQFTGRPVEQTEHRHLGGLAGRWNAQIRALLGPGMGQIGMGKRFRLIPEQEHDIARLGLRLQELAA